MFREKDLDGAVYVVCATDDPLVQEEVARAARGRTTIVNVVDNAGLCSAVSPAVVERGKLQIAVSTAGAAPGLARDIRQRLEREYPAWWEGYVDMLAQARTLVKERWPGSQQKRRAAYEALTAAGFERVFAAGGQVDALAALEAALGQGGRGVAR